MAGYTPMIQQYLRIKAEYQDAFLFFRLGDFYEMFFEDAELASQELEITLTSREGGTEDRIPMCGVPYHSAAGYIEQLIARGYKVAICEQTEDPKQAKGVVKREVVQLITPGTVMEGKGREDKENIFIASITLLDENSFGLAYNDLSTGEIRATVVQGRIHELVNELAAIGAREVVVDPGHNPEHLKSFKERGSMAVSFEEVHSPHEDFTRLLEGIKGRPDLEKTVSRLLHYLFRTQKRSLDHLQPVSYYEGSQFMNIDYHSKRNLELTETVRSKGKKGSLLWLLDETKTAMGSRILKQWIDRPLINRHVIEKRQNVVAQLLEQFFEREELRERLKEVYDLERLAGRVAFGNVNARDLLQLKKSLQQVPGIIHVLDSLGGHAKEMSEGMDPCGDLAEILENAIMESAPLSVKEGNMIKDGYHSELDRYRDASRNGKSWIAQLERDERERTGIKSLKIGYNRIFGYYLEITRANLHLLDDTRYERKQTLSNAERFITPELKEKEALILEAEEKSMELEYQLFLTLREKVKEYIPRLQQLAKAISELDALQCFAAVSEARHYTKPRFSEDKKLWIQGGRHPVVEKVMQAQSYVPNDCRMDAEREILLVTGPNMSGKSTFMRQIALTAILAQIGCFVPAEEAVLPIFDKVFTRIGAADDLISGQSTFMVEMLEAKNAIDHATENSLILFDEIGRGTSTYDGMALAQSIIEYIHDEIGAKTFFSTHYHELTVLGETLGRVQNVHVSAVEQNGKVVFLHKVKEGAADKSYGIHVAQLAELPDKLIKRANSILEELEKGSGRQQAAIVPEKKPATAAEVDQQLSFFGESQKSRKKDSKAEKALEEIKSLSVLEMTPLEALNALYNIQKKIKSL
ncbi:DNA mismatch repair protein MutS [Peribacillus kribbensis]|uniref:DNA mismatch repair protein MutS n=1 Tax=Peribacillus kribbensis TaxID=356658 RepID=UPI00047D1126|nr:DNA mismatch repair protein MutS [Peribacillus kribbensis]